MQSLLGDDVQGASNLLSYHPNMLKIRSLDMKEEKWCKLGRSTSLPNTSGNPSINSDIQITIPLPNSTHRQIQEPTSIFESHSGDVAEGSSNLPSNLIRESNWQMASIQNLRKNIAQSCAAKRWGYSMGASTSNSHQPDKSASFEDPSPLNFTDDNINTVEIETEQPVPENLESVKEELLKFANGGCEWSQVSSIYQDFPDSVRIPVNNNGDTSLHVAVSANNEKAVKMLLYLKHMTSEVLEIQNKDGDTAFCIAAALGHFDLMTMMIEKNQKLPTIYGTRGTLLPIHRAALHYHHEVVDYLSHGHLFEAMEIKDIIDLFFIAINTSMYDVAFKLIEKYPQELAVARRYKELTAMHLLVQKPSKEFGKWEDNDEETPTKIGPADLFKQLWSQVSQLEYKKILDLLSHPSVVLFDAVRLENVGVVKWLLNDNYELLNIKDPKNGHNILHMAALYRQHTIFRFILRIRRAKFIIRDMDKDGNNILHYAARHCPQEDTSLGLRPNIQMHKELVWFKEVEMRCPSELSLWKNTHEQTPTHVFYISHKMLSTEVKKEAKGIATSGMVVATVIASIGFAATLAVPKDKSNVTATIVFMLTNAIALITSSTSIVSFLSIFTSQGSTKGAYVTSLHPILVLNLGLSLLFISIAAMLTAFATASFLILDDKYKWVAYVVTSLGIFPILIFRMLEFRLLGGLHEYFVWYAETYISKSRVWIFVKSIVCRIKSLCNK